MHAAYAAYELHLVVQAANDLCTVDLSAFYLDVLKDRLYASPQESRERRSAQTALYLIARDVLRALAPVLSFTAEEAWGYLPRLSGDPDSVHLALHAGFDEPPAIVKLREAVSESDAGLRERYGFAREVRKSVNAALEEARRDKRIGSSVEAAVVLRAPAAELERLQAFGEAALADLFIVSAVRLSGTSDSLLVEVERAAGTKCARCWLYRTDVGSSRKHEHLCGRCTRAV